MSILVQLHGLFPNVPAEIVRDAARRSEYDVEMAISELVDYEDAVAAAAARG